MSIHGFEIKTAIDFFKKLLDEREDFLKNPASSRHAINCALTAWHLHEWVWAEYKKHPALSRFKRMDEFVHYLFSEADSAMQTMHDLANGSKHFKIDGRNSKKHLLVLKTELRPHGNYGPLKRPQKKSTLIITEKFADVGLIISFDDVLYLSTSFWYKYFFHELKVDVPKIFEENAYTWL